MGDSIAIGYDIKGETNIIQLHYMNKTQIIDMFSYLIVYGADSYVKMINKYNRGFSCVVPYYAFYGLETSYSSILDDFCYGTDFRTRGSADLSMHSLREASIFENLFLVKDKDTIYRYKNGDKKTIYKRKNIEKQLISLILEFI